MNDFFELVVVADVSSFAQLKYSASASKLNCSISKCLHGCECACDRKRVFFPALLNGHKKHLIPKINDPVPYSYAHISYRIMRMRMQMKEAEMLLSVSSCARIYIYNSSFSHSIPATLGLNLVMAIYWFTV